MSAATIKAALVALWTAALAADTSVQVSYGTPGATVVPDVIAVRDARSRSDGEEESVTVDVVVSCYVGGGDDSQPIATARAHSLLATVKAALDAAPTLDGACRVASVDVDIATGEAIGYDQTGRLPVGRLTQIDATVTAWTGRSLAGSLASAHTLP